MSAAMHDAAQRLVGRHDFTTFRAAECQAKSPVKTLDRLDVERHGDEVRIHASARSFLHHQVRSMVGSLVQVGDGRWSADDLARRARRPRPQRMRPGGAAGWALSRAGGLSGGRVGGWGSYFGRTRLVQSRNQLFDRWHDTVCAAVTRSFRGARLRTTPESRLRCRPQCRLDSGLAAAVAPGI